MYGLTFYKNQLKPNKATFIGNIHTIIDQFSLW